MTSVAAVYDRRRAIRKIIRHCRASASLAGIGVRQAVRLPYNSSAFALRGLPTNSPPQFGHTLFSAFVHGGQNVHS
jgi:hypothetical protein